MGHKERLILVVSMTFVMVAAVTFVATWLGDAAGYDFLWRWLESYVIAWPVAALTGFMILPAARRFTRYLLSLI